MRDDKSLGSMASLLREVAAMARPSLPGLAPGTVVDGTFVIEKKLGAGGMGVVYLGRDERLQRRVALKLHDADMDSERALDEAKVMAQLAHPNVVGVFDVSTVEGRLVIAMEYVDGGTLRAWLEQPHTWREILERFIQAGRGLAAAHAADLVHRDFKPDNVLIGSDGRVRVADFGLARRPGHANEAAGTPGYMAPEQRRGGTLDARSDQYAFCVALREALDSRAPRWLARVLARGTSDDPEQRYESMDVLLAALVRGPRHWRWAVPLAIGIAGVAAIALGWPEERPWQPQVRALRAYDENADHPRFSPDGTQIAYVSDRERQGFFRLYVEPLDGGEAHAVAPPDLTFHSYEWSEDGRSLLATASRLRGLYRLPVGGGAPVRIADGNVRACRGKLLAIGNPADCLGCFAMSVREAGGDRELARTEWGALFAGVHCDGRGRVVYAVQPRNASVADPNSDLYLVEIGGGLPRRLTFDASDNATPVFSADGESVVFSSSRDGATHLWELRLSGGSLRRLTEGDGVDRAPEVSRDGRLLVYDVDTTVMTLTAYSTTGGKPRRISTGARTLRRIDIAPDEKELIGVTLDGHIVVISLSDGAIRDVGAGTEAAFTSDGLHILRATEGLQTRLVLAPRKGGADRVLADLPGRVSAMAVVGDLLYVITFEGPRPRGWRVAIHDGAITPEPPPLLARADTARGSVIAEPRGGQIVYARLAPGAPLEAAVPFDGRTGAILTDGTVLVDRDGWIRAVDVATGEAQPLLELGGWAEVDMAPGGGNVYALEPTARVRRMLVENFDQR